VFLKITEEDMRSPSLYASFDKVIGSCFDASENIA
jgi:hypothetical protein